MSGYGRDSAGAEYGRSGGYSNSSGRDGNDRSSYDSSSGPKRGYSDHNSRGRDDDRGSYGDRGSGRNDHQSYSDSRGSGGYSRGRGDYHNNQSDSGNGSGGDSSQMETQPDTIFIQNLPRGVTTDELKDLFSQIGIIKKDKKTGGLKIWIYKDKATGEGKGEATITYEDEEAAQAAINWYNGKEVFSSVVKISLATRRASAMGGRGGFRGRGGGGFRGRGGGGDFGGYRGRGGDRGGDYRGGGGGGRGASYGSSRDSRSNPY